jgi:ABC-type polysaccharide/polyol phosphate export permease
MLSIALVLCVFVRPLGPMLVMLPIFLALLAIFTAGLGLLLSALNVYLRDVEFLFGALTMPWFFLTPILFTFGDLKSLQDKAWALRLLHYGNPVTPFIFGVQDSLFFARWPELGDLLYSAVAAAAMFLFGLWAFRRLERDLAVEL